jgi:2-succinyl-5-enolpyruvyl-6-hydroxy-3-cyclohexene-1-carboxylate synthase
VAAAYGIPVTEIASVGELPDALGGTGVRVVLARTERGANVVVHGEIEAAVAAAVSGAAAAG